MAQIFFAKRAIMQRFVRHHDGFAANVSKNNRDDVGNRRAVDMEATRRSAALYQRQHNILGCWSALVGLAFLPTDIGFVRLDDLPVPPIGSGLPSRWAEKPFLLAV